MKKTLLLSALVSAGLLILSSCGGEEKDDTLQAKTVTAHDTVKLSADMSEEAVNQIVQSIPTPLEISFLIKDAGAQYDANILNPADNASKYNSNKEIAFNIGVYSADLGYINLYEKTYSALEYLNAVKKLSDEIKVGQFFEFETLQRIAKNNKNYDSLLLISTENFNKMDQYLRDQKRGELSVLMISGAWLEGMHVATQVCKVKETKELTERIGYEKMNLDNILLIVNAYNSNKYFADLSTELQKLRKVYDKVSITREEKEPETKEVNGQLVIVDNSKSTVSIDEPTLKEITGVVDAIRGKMIKK